MVCNFNYNIIIVRNFIDYKKKLDNNKLQLNLDLDLDLEVNKEPLK